LGRGAAFRNRGGDLTFIMSQDNQADTSCASCGIAEIDDVKLVPCDDCDLVRYCSDECREDHKAEHEEACQKRAAELRDELLFKQPESSHMGDCPICTVPLPLDKKKSSQMTCCSLLICKGCIIANMRREKEMRLQHKCPFWREPTPAIREDADKLHMKRVEMNDPVAMGEEGGKQYNKGDYSRAFEYLTKAAALGDTKAHYNLSTLYRCGHGVEKNKGKEIYHLEVAAIAGHPVARYNLGCYEGNENGNIERAVKHLIIGATQGSDDSIKALMDMFKMDLVEKEDLAAALRAHKSALDATKSAQRKTAEAYYRE
jgi:hypothetical protein